ncbi:THAP domain-containing protein 1-like isoform X1 [Aphis craccivora]|uniref:THAP domain-containing protein 1-like isoform X1 n=1 Tax=Aphis craccivora TaxID=307492 RepID=A0A6G0Y943_APHCR|nr:THAP domain-containing protein 1-like isoform X1 [Aphis craccivora]
MASLNLKFQIQTSVEDIESPNSRKKFWLASRNTINTQQQKINVLRKRNARFQQKVSNMDQLISHLNKEKKIDENCFSFLKVDV